MSVRRYLWAAMIAGLSTQAFAQTTDDVDCDDPANAEDPVCIALALEGSEGVTAFVPLVAPAAGLLGLAALGAGGATATTTTSTTSTGN